MGENNGFKGINANARFIVVSILSLICIVCDSHFNLFKDVSFYVESYLTPVFYVADAPNSLSRNVSARFYSYQDLIEENRFLKEQIAEIRTELLRFDSLEEDNEQLRRLNNSPIRTSYKKIGAEIMFVDTNPFSLTIMINRGEKDGVYEGEPVINEEGVIGQVISVSKNISRVLLISDQNHAIPVVVMRNGIRAIASGTGVVNELSIVNMPRNVDIQVGDILITSGLGGKFPKGYPVAKVTAFNKKEGMQFAEIKAQPLAALDRLRYMLLVSLPQKELPIINSEEKENLLEKFFPKANPSSSLEQ